MKSLKPFWMIGLVITIILTGCSSNEDTIACAEEECITEGGGMGGSTSVTGNATAPLIIGRHAGGVEDLMNGHLDELRITNSNVFEASPNSSKTDTITMPTLASRKLVNAEQ
ncbi:MAG: hypothetical protein HQM14_21295 [SAR324 cluster bacterium]|nr:hypothetical protein [SAR324 cluster bacterium]